VLDLNGARVWRGGHASVPGEVISVALFPDATWEVSVNGKPSKPDKQVQSSDRAKAYDVNMRKEYCSSPPPAGAVLTPLIGVTSVCTAVRMVCPRGSQWWSPGTHAWCDEDGRAAVIAVYASMARLRAQESDAAPGALSPLPDELVTHVLCHVPRHCLGRSPPAVENP
jgi:hypothetical protein